jgi:predicted nucleic acid-binding protein
VPLVVEEPRSRACRQELRGDPRMIVWCFTRTEVVSALWRQHRTGRMRTETLRRAEARLEAFGTIWTEIDAVIPVRDVAEQRLRVHPLRAADALQLAAALVAFDERPRRRRFVTLDGTLAAAAEREGFDVLVP